MLMHYLLFVSVRISESQQQQTCDKRPHQKIIQPTCSVKTRPVWAIFGLYTFIGPGQVK